MINNELVELIKYIALTYLLGFSFYSVFFKNILRENNLFTNIAISWGLGVTILIYSLYVLAFNQKLGWITSTNLNCLLGMLSIILIVNSIYFRKQILSKLNVMNWISLLVLLFLLKPLFIDSLISYLIGFDAIAMWFLKAKSFLYANGVWDNLFFIKSGFEYTNKSYPIGFPLLIAGFFRLINFANDQIFQLYLLMFFINILFFVYGILRRKLNNLSVFSHILIIISLFFIPIFLIYAHNGYADMAVSFVFTTCIGLFILAQNKENSFRYQLLTLIISASGILIKNEAIPFFIILNSVFFITLFKKINVKKIIIILLTLLALSVPIILWEMFKSKYNLIFYLDKTSIIDPVIKTKTIVFHFMDEFIRTSYYSLTSIIVLLILASQTTYLTIKKQFSKLIPLIVVILMFLSYAYVYLITTMPLKTQLESSFERLFLHLLPSMYLVIVYQFGAIFEELGE